MISVLVPTLNNEQTLALCLMRLIHATVDGVVREVIICDAGSTDATLEIAEDAGAEVLAAAPGRALAEGAAAARNAWLMVLPPGPPLPEMWEKRVVRHMGRGDGKAGRILLDRPGLLSALGLKASPCAWLIPGRLFDERLKDAALKDLPRRLAGRVTVLD